MNDFSFYFRMGWDHIISKEALDHLLFIAALAAVYRLQDWKHVLILVSAFTAGHTITLVLSSKHLLTVDSTLVEFLIPLTIAATSLSNFFQRAHLKKAMQVNYVLALFFGMIHGLAFANLLRMILAEDQNFAVSMFSFSLGLESGQILVVLCMLLLALVFVRLLKLKRHWWIMTVSAVVFTIALGMTIERWP